MSPARSGDSANRPNALSQIALGLALFGSYVLVDALASPARRALAEQHGRDILRLEDWLHIDVEHLLNNALAPHLTLSALADYEYAWTYLLSTMTLLVWVWWRRPQAWRPVRDVFVVTNVLAIVTFWLWPAMPPRLVGGFVDTVSRGTVGSWGDSLVDSSNQVAAMPSLHLGWAIFVSYGLAAAGASRWLQRLSAVHVAVTAFVILATGNHYVLDGVAAFGVVGIGAAYARFRYSRRTVEGEMIAPADAFFLHVEETGAPQIVGGYVLFARPDGAGPALAQWRALVRDELVPQQRFHQRPADPTRWRRPRWVRAEPDLDWHVVERQVVGGERGLHRLVAQIAAEGLPRDRPLWRFYVVPDAGGGRPAIVFVVHHAMSDGINTVAHALHLFRPRIELPRGSEHDRAPRPLALAGATALGLAQLATDGGAARLPPGSNRRQFGAASVDFDEVRALARAHGVRVTDVLLALVSEGLRRADPGAARRLDGRFRVAITQAVAQPGDGAHGNATSSVMVDVPVDERPLLERLADIARATARVRRPTRLLASRFVLATGLRVLPEPAAAWFARTVYGSRFFHAVVSNLPGPGTGLTMLGLEPEQVLPILPVGPGATMSVGALAWAGRFGLGVATDPALLDAEVVATAIPDALAEIGGSRPPTGSVASEPGHRTIRSVRRRPLQSEEQPRPLPR